MKRVISSRSPVSAPAGFSLVELVVGIVVSAIALTLLTNLFFSNAGRSVEPMMQIRAAEFGQAIMEEILAKNFDEQTPVGGVPACTSCTPANSLGPDGESRDSFDDVDDYNSYCGDPNDLADRVGLSDTFGNALSTTGGIMAGYQMKICVGYDNNYDGVVESGAGAHSNPKAKLISVYLFPPSAAGLNGGAIQFNAYRSNF